MKKRISSWEDNKRFVLGKAIMKLFVNMIKKRTMEKDKLLQEY